MDSAEFLVSSRLILNLLVLGDLLGDLGCLLALSIVGFGFGLGERLFLLGKLSCVLDGSMVILSTEPAPKCKVVYLRNYLTRDIAGVS